MSVSTMPLSSMLLAPETPASRETGFIVGQDGHGRWVAMGMRGLAGGLFRSCEAAIHYAAAETQRRPDAVVLSAERVEFRVSAGGR